MIINKETDGDYIRIDEETGEIIPKEGFVCDTPEKAEWVMGQLMAYAVAAKAAMHTEEAQQAENILAVIIVLSNGELIGYLQQVEHTTRGNKICKRWRIYASWTGQPVTGGKAYRTRREATEALEKAPNVIASVLTALHKHFG